MIIEHIKPFTTWLHLHPHWAMLITFLVAFTESIAIIGSIIPGSITLTAIGILIGTGIIPIGKTFFFAIIGAILGDALSFWFGWYYQSNLHQIWPFPKYPNLLVKGENFFHRHGGKSIFIGRFFGPMRSILPTVAGMLNMSVKHFLIADIFSAILWAPTYMLPGILLGAASIELDPETATHLIFVVLLLLVIIWLSTLLIRYLIIWQINTINRALDSLWSFMRAHKTLRPLTALLVNPRDPEHHGQFLLALVLVMVASSGAFVTYSVSQHGIATLLDQPLHALFTSLRSSWLDPIITGITMLGDKIVLLPVLIMLSVWFLSQRRLRTSIYWLGNGVYAALSVWLAKHWFFIARPSGLVLIDNSYSFPSGHTTLTTAMIGFLSFLLCEHLSKEKRSYVYFPAFIFIALIAFSRLYLGAHWFSDVLGALLIGVSCSIAFALFYRLKITLKLEIYKTIFLFVIFLSLTWFAYYLQAYSHQRFASQLKLPEKVVQFKPWWEQIEPIFPLYRQNRLGHDSQVLNIQWVGTIDHIEELLSKHHWKVINDSGFINFLAKLTTKDKTQVLPLLSHLYLNQRPILLLTKQINKTKPVLILEIWPSRASFLSIKRPLWIASIHYRLVWHHHWLKHHKKHLDSLPLPLAILEQALASSNYKIVSFSTDPDENIILIR